MKFISMFLMLFSLTTIAQAEDDARVKVTSFRYVGNSRIAELCGTVLVPYTDSMRITAKVDPGRNEAFYTILPPQKGTWCQLVLTLSGKADVTLLDGDEAYTITAKTRRR